MKMIWKKYMEKHIALFLSLALIISCIPLGNFSFAVSSKDTAKTIGELTINKESSRVGDKNLFDIVLTIDSSEDKDTTKVDTDIILVIDRSGSMGDRKYTDIDRMTPTKTAVKEFINTVIPESGKGQTRVGIMTFDDQVSYPDVLHLTNKKDILINELNDKESSYFKPRNDTFTHLAYKEAREKLENSTAKNKYMIMLTDGLPSITYKLKDWKKGSEAIWAKKSSDGVHMYMKHMPEAKIHPNDTVGNDYCTTDKINLDTMVNYDASYPMSDKPDGTYKNAHIYDDEIYIQMQWDPKDKYGKYPFDPFLNLNNLYKAEAKRSQGIHTYAIGIEMFPVGMKIMGDLVGEANTFKTTTSGLSSIYSQLAKEVVYLTSDAVVTDPMGEMFSMVDSNGDGKVNKDDVKVVDKDGKPIDGALIEWDEDTETIKVSIPKIAKKLSPIKIKYQVTLDGKDAKANTLYPTNKTTTIDYTDLKGEKKQAEFPIPEEQLDKSAFVKINYKATTGGSVSLAYEEILEKYGEAVGSTATAEDGYKFVNWTNGDDVVSTDETYVPPTKSASYVAHFTKKIEDTDTDVTTNSAITINYQSEDETKGTVSIDKETLKLGEEAEGSTATAKDGYVFDYWSKVDDDEFRSKDETLEPNDKLSDENDESREVTYIAHFKEKETTAKETITTRTTEEETTTTTTTEEETTATTTEEETTTTTTEEETTTEETTTTTEEETTTTTEEEITTTTTSEEETTTTTEEETTTTTVVDDDEDDEERAKPESPADEVIEENDTPLGGGEPETTTEVVLKENKTPLGGLENKETEPVTDAEIPVVLPNKDSDEEIVLDIEVPLGSALPKTSDKDNRLLLLFGGLLSLVGFYLSKRKK